MILTDATTRDSLLSTIEPLMTLARDEDDRVALRLAAGLARSCGDLAYVHYEPADVLSDVRKRYDDDALQFGIEPIPTCVGVPEIVATLIEFLIRSVELQADAELVVEGFVEDDVPMITLTFDGPGRFPEVCTAGGRALIVRETVGTLWTRATRGGRLDVTAQGLALRLTGMREPAEPIAELDELCSLLDAAALGGKTCADVLAYLDGEHKEPQPGDLVRLLNEVLGEIRPQLLKRGIKIETYIDGDMPPVTMYRERLRAAFINLGREAWARLRDGGAVVIMADYNAEQRQVDMAVTLAGIQPLVSPSPFKASMQRALVETYDGVCEYGVSGDEAQILCAVPDPVGRTLDEWLPGWERFGTQSQQMLRLLKSGGQAPPAELLLPGVLEAELERWLLPILDSSAAVNIAYETDPRTDPMPGGNPDRRAKVLQQIARGKVKKEICAPPYAAEILWAFRRDERSRNALGLDHMTSDALAGFAAMLVQSPTDHHSCLCTLAHFLSELSRP